MRPVSRRTALGLLGAGAVGLGAAGAGGAALAHAGDTSADSSPTVPFDGAHQAGIATDMQGHLHVAAFDVTSPHAEDLTRLLQRWTVVARALTAGRSVGDDGALGGNPLAPPEDTGEALDLGASRLTVTVGLGPSLFDDRFGLADRRPAALVDLPAFGGDALDPARCGGDLVVQACADDPQVAVHAVRNLVRAAAGTAAVRWSQLGFGRASSTRTSGPTPRNLFGFKDGTANVLGTDDDALDQHVWVAADDDPRADWMVGGSYLVARRVEMLVEAWDRTSLTEQEHAVGRSKGEGAPLGSSKERDPVDPHALPVDSHVAIAHPSNFGGAQLLRRGYSFVDGSDGLGHLDAGLFFLAYQRDPRTAFVPVQTALSRNDALNEYLRHTGSGIWAVPGGTSSRGWWAQELFA